MERIVVAEVADDAGGDLQLARALDELMPDYRKRVVEEPMLDLDYVRLRLATRPGSRHVVGLNGHDFGGASGRAMQNSYASCCWPPRGSAGKRAGGWTSRACATAATRTRP